MSDVFIVKIAYPVGIDPRVIRNTISDRLQVPRTAVTVEKQEPEKSSAEDIEWPDGKD